MLCFFRKLRILRTFWEFLGTFWEFWGNIKFDLPNCWDILPHRWLRYWSRRHHPTTDTNINQTQQHVRTERSLLWCQLSAVWFMWSSWTPNQGRSQGGGVVLQGKSGTIGRKSQNAPDITREWMDEWSIVISIYLSVYLIIFSFIFLFIFYLFNIF